MDDTARLPPLLLPTPRRLRVSAGRLSVPATVAVAGDAVEAVIAAIPQAHAATSAADAWLTCRLGEVEEPGVEAYQLTIGAVRCQLVARTIAGLRCGAATLAQLLRQYGDAVPELTIDDAPAFTVRGVMLDVSRCRVPTMAELGRVVATLAGWKINHLQLYTEHTFAYRGHQAVWAESSPMTGDEIRELDALCAGHGIALVANQNCFGHLERWFKHPAYAPLAEIPPDGKWTFNGLVWRDGGFSLCPSDPGALPLVDNLLDQLLPCFSTRLVNIGCDETFDLGQGRSREDVVRRGRAEVYLDFVARICASARMRGFRPMFWADIALEHPEALARLPDDLICLAWGYEGSAPFARWCEQLRSIGREVWVCPGTSSWCSITGRTEERRQNLLAAARDGLAGGALGYLITDWGDHGHRQQWPIALNGLAEGAHRAWSGTADFDVRATSLHAFSDRSLTVASWLDALGNVDLPLRRIGGRPAADGTPTPLSNNTALFVDLHKPLDATWVGDHAIWTAVAQGVAALAPPDFLASGVPLQLAHECRHAWRVAELAAVRGACRRTPDGKLAYTALASTLRQLIAEHRALWLERSRPGGLAESCAHYQRVADEFDAVGLSSAPR
ncbi:MAG: family 20 glycosylhydrolase [Planctomycetes bacterium]|nr:family 20 glycosylhydrolase [Planctomycetota bacterium]